MSGSDPIIDAVLCRAARGALGWSQDQLAVASSVSRDTILGLERGYPMPWRSSRRAIQAALVKAGIRFGVTEEGDAYTVTLVVEIRQQRCAKCAPQRSQTTQ